MERKEARRRAEELVGKMTLEERASQLRYGGKGGNSHGFPAGDWYGGLF